MKSTSTISRKRSHGMAIVSAIFLLVALAVLGAGITKISSNTAIGQSYDFNGAKAYQAARLGLEWGSYQMLKGACSGGDYCALCRSTAYGTPTPSTQQNINGLPGDLSAYTVTVSCGSGAAAYTEGSNSVWVYQIVANACNQPDAGGSCPNSNSAAVSSLGYSERRLSLTVSN